MTRRTHPRDLMWAQACDLIEQAGRMRQQFFRRASAARVDPAWEPPADVFEDERELAIVVALPGVSPERVETAVEGGMIVVRAERPMPLEGARRAVRQLEIPYGYFERRIPLPAGRFEPIANELTHGCLVVRLRKVN